MNIDLTVFAEFVITVFIVTAVLSGAMHLIRIVVTKKDEERFTKTDRPECQAGYKPDWVLLDEKTGADRNIVTICRNCGANLNGKAKCEYCGTVYPENMFLLIQKEDTEARKRADSLMACGLFHTELSEIDEDIKHIKAEIEKIRE